jgi:hypothetical protein
MTTEDLSCSTDEIERLGVTRNGRRDLRNPNALHHDGGGVRTQSR